MPSLAGDRPPRLLHELFETQADRTPDAPAVICVDRALTYGEVERQANQLARHLQHLGAEPGVFVAIYLDRSERSIIAILAVLKAGAAYVPIDPVYPADRVRHILSDAEVRLVLTEQTLAPTAAAWGLGVDLLVLDAPLTVTAIGQLSAERLDAASTGVGPEDLCYVMYTSGTTGRPKGILTEHRNVVAFTHAFQAVCQIAPADRIFQGFSLGFDGSVEEYVLAFAGGAVLVVGPPALAGHGAETSDYLAAHGVTYFSTVPTFLRLIRPDIPSLRLIVVSGEPCPPDLVRAWTRPGRRMLNVYGPTEATVNTTWWECEADRPVSIGRPLEGYQAYLLDQDGRPVTDGPGELYVGGVGVARGYLNQPDLTARQFVADPFAGDPEARMYRTGDLVEADGQGEFRFLGRLDTQVKVRGFRIELGEIEAVLGECPGVVAAAVTVVTPDGQAQLAAFVVAPDLDRDATLAHLRARLPPYMVPAFLDRLEALPRLASGKLNRQGLPEPHTRLVATGRRIVAPRDESERRLVSVWEALFRVAPVSVEDDFFLDLGGDSLLAATLVTTLHAAHGVTVSLRDVYRHSTIARLATVAAQATPRHDPALDGPRASSQAVFDQVPAAERTAAALLQLAAATALYGLGAIAPWLACLTVLQVVDGAWSLGRGVGLLVAIVAASYPAWLVLTIGLKWLLVGRYRPGPHPAYGVAFVRFWLARRIQALSGAGLLSGTPLMAVYYRLMGAQVGRNCVIDTPFCAAFDLVTIGDDASIGAETHLLGYRLRDGIFELGRVDIGARAFVGIHAALGLNSRVGNDARLGDLSLLPDDAVIPDGEAWRGSPASPGAVPVPVVPVSSTAVGPGWAFGLLFAVLAVLLELVVVAGLAPGAALVWALRSHGWTGTLVGLACAVPVAILSVCLVLAAVKALVLRRIGPGTYPVRSGLYVRKWFVDGLVTQSRVYLHALYTTIYLPPWLRLLGARIGRRAEVSTIAQGAPDLFVIGEQSFFADGSLIGGRRFYRGHLQVAYSEIGRRSFVGNSAILPVGSGLGEGCLLGVLSTPPEQFSKAPDRTEWLGSPSFALPHRNKVEGFDDAVTFEPTGRLIAHRLVVDAVRILIPGAIAALAGLTAYALTRAACVHLSLLTTLLLEPPAALLIAIGAVLLVVALKIGVMGRFEPVIKPLWSPYVWWNEVVNGAWETIAAPALAPLVGSPLFNVALRLMGCEIGRGAQIHTTLFSEFDLVHIGPFAALGEGVIVQNHLFEDRIMKSSQVTIGAECSVGNMAVILYDTYLQTGATLDPLSLVMKGTVVSSGTRWVGIPASAASAIH